MNWSIRPGGPADTEACHAVYFDAVRNGTAPLYTAEQARAWAPSETSEEWLEPRLASGTTWVASSDNRAEGFLTVTDTGHLDFFFVRPEWRRTGLASSLYQCMAVWAAERGKTTLTTFASHLCRRFLEKRGWAVLEAEKSLRNGVAMERWTMEWHAS